MKHTTAIGNLDAAGIADWCASLRGLGGPVDEAQAIDQIAALERLKSAASAAQARVTATLRETRITREADEGVPVGERGRGLADEVALARREPASQGSRHLGLAAALAQELPHTLEHLAAGTVSEWGATVMARETAVLEPEDRRRVDADLDERRGTMTVRQIERAARGLTLAVDATAIARRRARAKADRRVSIRPQPDTMASMTALLPVEQGVAAWSALTHDAEALKAAGDGRGLGQLMADLFVERLTGQSRADAVPIEVHLVMGPGTMRSATTTTSSRESSPDPRRQRTGRVCALGTTRRSHVPGGRRARQDGRPARRQSTPVVSATSSRAHPPGTATAARCRRLWMACRRFWMARSGHAGLKSRGSLLRGSGSVRRGRGTARHGVTDRGDSGPVGKVCDMTVPLGRPRRMTARRAISGSARA